jgi:hypothetical protein
MLSVTASIPVIEPGGRRGPSDEGKLLRLPENRTPISEETHSPEAASATLRSIQALREEEQRAADAGMTVDELRSCQDLLLKKF